MKTAQIKVTLKDHMGNDLDVVNAARVSFHKESEWDTVIYKNVMGCIVDQVLKPADEKLIQYLAKHKHWTPFAHNSIKLHIKAPLFVARQLVKHQVGGVWNEVSRRYVSDEPEFFWPEYWRSKADNVKQGSGEPFLRYSEEIWGTILRDIDTVIDTYNIMITDGVCPEQARMILPQNMMTEWIWTGSLAFFARVCKDRLQSTAQKETQEVAEQISSICEELFPVSWKALMENNNN